MIGDKGCDSDKIRTLLLEQGITPCIPPRRNRNKKVLYSKKLYKMRHKVEDLFAKCKNWRRVTTPCDRCAHIFLSAVFLTAVLISSQSPPRWKGRPTDPVNLHEPLALHERPPEPRQGS